MAKRRSKAKTADGRRLPEEMVVEILLHLPVKSLVRFRCASRHWCSLIKSPEFITRHHLRQTDLLLVTRGLPSPNNPDYVLSLHDDFEDVLHGHPNLLQSVPFLNDVPDYNHKAIEVMGPSHGIVCFRPPNNDIILSNPGLMEFNMVPRHTFAPPEGFWLGGTAAGFGFVLETNECKVVLLIDVDPDDYPTSENGGYCWACVYRSRSNSWTLIGHVEVPDRGWCADPCLLFNGVCHWYAITVIFYFDISSEAFGSIELPDKATFADYNITIDVLDGCLAAVLFHYHDQVNEPHHIKIWVMKEYGVVDSWTNLYSLGPRVLSRPLVFLKNEWLLVQTHEDGQLASFPLLPNREIKRLPTVRGTPGSVRAVIYKESLISLDHVANF